MTGLALIDRAGLGDSPIFSRAAAGAIVAGACSARAGFAAAALIGIRVRLVTGAAAGATCEEEGRRGNPKKLFNNAFLAPRDGLLYAGVSGCWVKPQWPISRRGSD